MFDVILEVIAHKGVDMLKGKLTREENSPKFVGFSASTKG